MDNKTIIAIRRDARFSPGAVEQDRAILEAVAARCPAEVRMIDECRLQPADEADVYISMGRDPHTLAILRAKEAEGRRVVNSSSSVRRCARRLVEQTMRTHGIAMPPERGKDGYWLKRGDGSAQSDEDIVFCRDETELAQAEQRFRERGISDMVVSAHVVGDLVKFYCVGNEFFRYYRMEEEPVGYTFDEKALHAEVQRVANLIGTEVYGGDCIVSADGRFSLIDFNDWPSFSRCREEAADAIAEILMR